MDNARLRGAEWRALSPVRTFDCMFLVRFEEVVLDPILHRVESHRNNNHHENKLYLGIAMEALKDELTHLFKVFIEDELDEEEDALGDADYEEPYNELSKPNADVHIFTSCFVSSGPIFT